MVLKGREARSWHRMQSVGDRRARRVEKWAAVWAGVIAGGACVLGACWYGSYGFAESQEGH